MAEKRRVAIIMPELFHGGAETQFRTLIDNLDSRRFSVTVFVERSYNVVETPIAASWVDNRQSRVRFVQFRGLRTNDGNLRRLVSAVKLAAFLTPYLLRREFDAVLVYSALGMRMTPLLRMFGTFVIFSERNSAHYSKFDLARKRVYFSAANIIVCNSSAAGRNFVGYGYEPEVIENAVTPAAGTRETAASRADGLTIVVPGRIARVKNQELAIKALHDLEGVSCLYLAGAVEDSDYLDTLKRLIGSLGPRIRIEVLGFVRDMDALYAKCDLVVLPSRSEGMPNVLLEALARGVPCVASDLPSHRDVLKNDALLFDVDDPISLASAVEHISQMTLADVQELATKYRTYVSERFSVCAMVSAYEELFARNARGEAVG